MPAAAADPITPATLGPMAAMRGLTAPSVSSATTFWTTRADMGTALTPVDWISRHPEMAVGEPQRATSQKGAEIARLWSEAIIDQLRLIKRDAVVPTTLKSTVARVHAIREEGA